MSSAYGALDSKIQLPTALPLTDSLKDGKLVTIRALEKESEAQQLHQLLNDIIREGETYPHENILTFQQFDQYFKTGFVCIDSNERVLGGTTTIFYKITDVLPNCYRILHQTKFSRSMLAYL
jgi:hypothetical protein